ncbi:WD domain protein [Lentithecium fluviatile CBS 122367]|uniref:WD domain protein n=1 Tax=Lentithecium fluviatile CBS 122367 TaxID=1168545 RepID=A0A6G1IPV5_9PLEO|nr:WD domain protein [Lentithecium fluviatile CBS 122367]
MSRRLPREQYTVGWVCALPVELAAALEMLDEEHDLPERYDNDENLYHLGSIAGHNVVVVCLPAGRIGNNPAAAVAMQTKAAFRGIRFGLMVGIGGGVPRAGVDIRLGDVVVSQPDKTFGGVVQYDSGKATLGGFERTGSLNSPPGILLAAVASVQANEFRGKSKLTEHIAKLENVPKFRRDKAGLDILFEATYNHGGGQTCGSCSTDRQEARQPRESGEEVVAHYGTIASGNQVIKNAAERDKVSAELGGVLCFEMEAAGLMNSFPCLVIRGICDYADSHKNKTWQPYAAGTAAAYAKEVLSMITPADVARTRTVDEAIRSVDQRLNVVDKKADTLLSKIDMARLPTAKGASFDSHIEEHNSTCLQNTRTELLDHIQEWAKDKSGKPIFWLNGAAGTGKSTIARTVARTFADQRQLGASFFFKRGEGECGNATRFFTTIATQLAVRVPEIESGIKKAVDADPAISDKALKDQFEKIILQPLLEVFSLPALVLVIVVDALDECEQDSDIRTILQLLSRTRGLKPVSLRILVTSRPEFHIRLGFKRMHNGTYKDLILHNVSKKTIEHDIRAFFEHELGQIQQQRSLSPNWPSRDQVDALVKQAVPLFIFAATACRYIGDRRDNPKKRLEIILGYRKVTASKLDATYLPILNQLFDEEDEEDKGRWASDFQEIVGSIVVLEAPLSTASLARLLCMSKEDVSCRLDLLHSILSIPDRDDMPVRLLHLSFREFLVDASKEKSPFWVDERARHERLASHCLELMSSLDGLRQNMCGLQPGSLRRKINNGKITSYLSPELQYACRYWVYHIEQSQHHINNKDSTDIFLRKHFLHWLEAMSLIRETNKCAHLLETLYALANPLNSNISLFLQDARRFTLRFRHILEEAPLQIYSSALVFTPEASIIRRAFVDEIPRWIKMLSKREVDWDACRSVLEGHTSWVSAVAFSPDGQLAATGSCRSVLEGHTSWVSAVAFSPDGHCLHTDQGDIPLPSPSTPSPSSQKKQSPNVFIQDQWVVSSDQERLLWLPSEYRPTCSTVDKDLVCLGHSSGRITLLKVSTIRA